MFVLYGNSLRNGYSFDDDLVIQDNQQVLNGIRGIPSIFVSHYYTDERQSFGYRPVVLATFAIEYSLFGEKPEISHLINIIIYALTCLILYLLLLNLNPSFSPTFPLLTTLLFLAHPLHSEVVDNLKSRDELLCLSGCLLSAYFFLVFTDTGKKRYYLTGILLLILSLLCKRTAAVFFVLIPLMVWFFRPVSLKKLLVYSLPVYLVIALSAFFARTYITDGGSTIHWYWENPLGSDPEFFRRIPMALFTLAYYVRLLALPHPLSYYYGFNQVPISGWNNPIIWITAIFLILICFIIIKKISSRHLWIFGILFFLIPVSPFLNLLTPVDGIIAERLAYSASAGFCWIAALAIMSIFRIPLFKDQGKNRIKKPFPSFFYPVVCLILLLYSIRVVSRNPDWKDRLTLYSADIGHLKNSCKAHSLLGDELYKMMESTTDAAKKEILVQQIEKYYLRALEIYPDYSPVLNNLASIYFQYYNDYRKARVIVERAILFDPDSPELHFNLGYCCEMAADTGCAITSYKKAIALDERYYPASARLRSIIIMKGGTLNYTRKVQTPNLGVSN
ncbi:MAG: tetratricopeptide repeat protein [Bacteroidetes bacterium]|nr:tetratricopeptide repeat protein [Bacteroidota bacterium]